MWTLEQSTGHVSQDSAYKGTAYSGFGAGKNNPAMQDDRDIGPIPCGLYTMKAPFKSAVLGLFVMSLAPDPNNVMFGRDDFYCHGDSISHPGKASHGCMVASHFLRQMMWTSNDHELRVVAGEIA